MTQTTAKTETASNQASGWTDLELGIDEMDEPIFIPMEIIPNGSQIDGTTAQSTATDEKSRLEKERIAA